MAKAKAAPKISPRGIFVFPHLINPDYEFKESGEYSVKLRVSAEDGEELKNEIDKAADTFHKAKRTELGRELKTKEPPYTVDEESGDILFSFKKNTSFKDKDTGKVVATSVIIKTNVKIDGKYQNHPRDVDIWGGTVGRVAFRIHPYLYKGSTGIRLNLIGARILTLVTGGQRDLFGDEDADYEGEDCITADSAAAFDDAEDVAGDGDF